MDRMTVNVEWKASGADDGTLEGYASTFGNVDLGADVVVKGAFADTLANIKANGIPLLADHVASTSSVLGTIFDAEQDEKGLLIKARFSSAPSAQDVRIKMAEGHLGKLSIGYIAEKFGFEQRDGKRVRLLQKINLLETSVVVFPMNPEATIERVKSLATNLSDEQRRELASAIALADGKATANDIRDRLNTLVREAYGDDNTDVWVRDYDDATVWFDVYGGEESGTYAQPYASDDDGPTDLGGERMRVRAVTTYVPDDGKSATADHPAGQAGSEDEKAAPAGEPAESSWDHWASEAVLAGADPEAIADPAARSGMATRLELMEQSLKELDEPVHPDIRAGLAASLRQHEEQVRRSRDAVPATARGDLRKSLALLEDDPEQVN